MKFLKHDMDLKLVAMISVLVISISIVSVYYQDKFSNISTEVEENVSSKTFPLASVNNETLPT